MSRWWLRCVGIASAGLTVTVVVAIDPALSFAYHAPVARAILETAIFIVGTLVAFLVLGRYRRHRSPRDLAVAGALAILAWSSPLFVALPSLALHGRLRDVSNWTYLVARVCAASLLLWASAQAVEIGSADLTRDDLSPIRVVNDHSWWPIRAVPTCVLASVVLLLFFHYDPDTATAQQALTGAPRPLSEPGVALIQLACFVLFIAAAVRFSRRRYPIQDPLLGWLSIGCVFIAIASVDYALYPTINQDELHIGDLFRLASVLVFAVGAGTEIRSYWEEGRRLARLEERRAVARDLHDGIAQELAFLQSQVREHTRPGLNDGWLDQVRAATDRALAESRRAIAALATDKRPSLSGDLEQTLRQIALDGTSLELDIGPSSTPSWFDPGNREVVIRIVREAVINAVRHGGAKVIQVRLGDEDEQVLRVVDDGAGFDPSAIDTSRDRFGLVMMRERAQSIGARFAVRSVPGKGTTIELSWATAEPSTS